MARLTLNGMYQYDPTIFDGMNLPPDYDREALFAEIMTMCGQLYPYHQQPFILKSNIRLWFARNYLNFDRIMEALIAEYNPIENYNRHENWTRTPNLDDTETRTGTDTQAHSGSDTDTHTGNNTLALSGTDTVAQSGKDTVKDSGTDTVALSGIDTVALSGTDTVALSGTDTVALSAKDTVQDSGTDTETRTYTNYHETITNTGSKTTEEQVSAFDSSTYEPSKKTIETPAALNEDKEISGSYEDATAHGKKEETTYGKSEGTTYGKSEGTTYGKSESTTYGKSEGTTYGKQEETAYGKSEGTTYGRQETDTHNTTDTTTYNSQQATTYGTTFKHAHTGNEQYTSHVHGNIGVTTSQQMIQSEIELRQFDIYTDIARRFEYEFMVQVY